MRRKINIFSLSTQRRICEVFGCAIKAHGLTVMNACYDYKCIHSLDELPVSNIREKQGGMIPSFIILVFPIIPIAVALRIASCTLG